MKNTKITFASAKSGKPFSLQLLDCTNDRNYFFCANTAKVCVLGEIKNTHYRWHPTLISPPLNSLPQEIVEWLCAFRVAKALALGLNLGAIESAKEVQSCLDIAIFFETMV